MLRCLMISSEVATVLEGVPEFADRFLCLVEAADGDPGAPAAFCELADFVASLVSSSRRPDGVLVRCLARLEQVARESDDAEELVGWSFLDSLCPEDLSLLTPWLGPCTLALAEGRDARSFGLPSAADNSRPTPPGPPPPS
jgi:hypothetical protein